MLAAADELAQTGECDATEIYSEAHELEQRMHGFLTALQRRRAVLDLTVIFYSHVHEVCKSFRIYVSVDVAMRNLNVYSCIFILK